MTRLLPLLLLCLTLLTAACKKDKTEPTIEGRWTVERVVNYYFDATNTLQQTSDSSQSARSFYMVISKDSLMYYDVKDNHYLSGWKITHTAPDAFTITYTDPNSSTSAYTRVNCQVKELTAHTLVLQLVPNGRVAARQHKDYVFSR